VSSITVALPAFAIALREGVEAALVVGIVLACCRKARRPALSRWVYAGIGAGLAASAIVAVAFGELVVRVRAVGAAAEFLLEAGFGLLAIGLLSWMLVWMTRQAKSLKAGIEGEITEALNANEQRAGWVVFGLVTVAIVREGFETVVFLTAKLQQGWLPALGSILGIGVAAAIGVAMFKFGLRLNLRLFFQVMGGLLLAIISGLVVTSLAALDSAIAALATQGGRAGESLCFFHERFVRHPSCVLGPRVWDLSSVLPEDGFPGMLLNALFGYQQHLFWVQAIAYGLFLTTLAVLYFRSLGWRWVVAPIGRSSQLPESSAD